MIIEARTSFGNNIFREVFITACWIIWLTRNAVVFDSGQIDINAWKRHFREEFGLVCTKAKPARQQQLRQWRDSFM